MRELPMIKIELKSVAMLMPLAEVKQFYPTPFTHVAAPLQLTRITGKNATVSAQNEPRTNTSGSNEKRLIRATWCYSVSSLS
jgi:hypothetical protein